MAHNNNVGKGYLAHCKHSLKATIPFSSSSLSLFFPLPPLHGFCWTPNFHGS